MNARPLLLALGALALGIVAAPAAPQPSLLLAAMALCLVAGLLLARRPAGMVGALLAALALFGAGRARLAMTVAPDDVSRHIGGPSVWVLGTLASDAERKPGRRQLMLSVRAVHDYAATRPASGLLQVTVRDGRGPGTPRPPRLAYGDEVWLRGRVEAPPGATNPGGFDYRSYLARRGVFAALTTRRAADVRPTGRASGTPFGRAAAWLRATVQAASARHLAPADAALLDGLLLSIRGQIPPDVEDAFSRTGTVHVLSTSGLHLAVLAAFLSWLSHRLPLPRRWANLAVVCVIWVYALAAGAGPAVTRSALMITVLLAAPLARRDADPLNSLLLAAFLILLHSPLALYDAGTQLSFFTVATLLAWAPPLERRFFPWEPGMGWGARMARGVIGGFAVGVVAQAGSWPLVAWHFNLFSPVAPLANLPVAFWSGILLLAGLAAVALAWAPVLGGLLFALLIGPGLSALRLLVLLFAALPWAAVSVASPPVALIALYYALLWGAATFAHEHTRRKTLFAPGPAPAAPGGGWMVGVPASRP